MTRNLPSAHLLALFLGASAAGCHDAPCTPEVCDIRDGDCQRSAMNATACLSGVDQVEVDVRVVTNDEYHALLVASVDAGNVAPFDLGQAALALLGLAPPTDSLTDVARERADTTAAAYFEDQRAVYVIDRGQALASPGAVSLLIHEFTHAIQFQTEGRLPEAASETFDRQLARLATIEGEAVWNMDRALLLAVGSDPEAVHFRQVYDDWAHDAMRRYQDEKRKVTSASVYFAYPFGSRFLHDQDLSRPSLPIAASSREVVTGQPAEVAVVGQVPSLADERLAFDSLGHFVVTGWLGQALAGRGATFWDPLLAPSTVVVDDTITLLRSPEGRLGAVWRIEFGASTETASIARFASALTDASPSSGHLRAVYEGHTLMVFANEDVDTAVAWATSPPTFVPLAYEAGSASTDIGAVLGLSKGCPGIIPGSQWAEMAIRPGS